MNKAAPWLRPSSTRNDSQTLDPPSTINNDKASTLELDKLNNSVVRKNFVETLADRLMISKKTNNVNPDWGTLSSQQQRNRFTDFRSEELT